MTKEYLTPHSGVFELYAVDFVLDDQLQPWIVDIDNIPIISVGPTESDFIIKMLNDMFEIHLSIYRSRMKRIFKVVRKLYAEILKLDKPSDYDYIELANEFKTQNKNKIDSDFEISQENSWVKIVDWNKKSGQRYSYLIDSQCINDS